MKWGPFHVKQYNLYVKRIWSSVKTEYASHSTKPKTFSPKDTHYKVLGIKTNASTSEIRGAFLKKSREFHPDVNQEDPNSEQNFVRINEAYSVLNKPSSKLEYDNSLVKKTTSKPKKKTVHYRYPEATYGTYESKENFYYSWDNEDREKYREQFHTKNRYHKTRNKTSKYSNRQVVMGLLIWMVVGGGFCFVVTVYFYLFMEKNANFTKGSGTMYFTPKLKAQNYTDIDILTNIKNTPKDQQEEAFPKKVTIKQMEKILAESSHKEMDKFLAEYNPKQKEKLLMESNQEILK